MDKKFVLIIITIFAISFTAGATTVITLQNDPTIDGQVPVWNASSEVWNPSEGIYFPLDGNTLCFTSDCDTNIIYENGDLLVNG